MILLFPQHLPHPLAGFTKAILSLQTLVNLNHSLTHSLETIVTPNFLFRRVCLSVPTHLRRAHTTIPIFPQKPTYLPLGALIVSPSSPLVVLVLLAHPSHRLPGSLALSPFSPGRLAGALTFFPTPLFLVLPVPRNYLFPSPLTVLILPSSLHPWATSLYLHSSHLPVETIMNPLSLPQFAPKRSPLNPQG